MGLDRMIGTQEDVKNRMLQEFSLVKPEGCLEEAA